MPQDLQTQILGLTRDFNNDTDPRKVSVGAGAYRGEDGKPWVLPSVREAEQRILDAKMNHEYLPISGDADFVKVLVGVLIRGELWRAS